MDCRAEMEKTNRTDGCELPIGMSQDVTYQDLVKYRHVVESPQVKAVLKVFRGRIIEITPMPNYTSPAREPPPLEEDVYGTFKETLQRIIDNERLGIVFKEEFKKLPKKSQQEILDKLDKALMGDTMPKKTEKETEGTENTETEVENVVGEKVQEFVKPAEGQPLIYAALINLQNSVEAIIKRKQSSGVSYKFRGIDDVMNAIHPKLVEHGIFIVPFIDSVKNTMYEVDKYDSQNKVVGKRSLFHAVIVASYRFYATDGSYVEARVCAESSDYSDKATQQALSYCYKIAVLQTLSIPTEEMKDGDERNPDNSTAKTTAAKKETVAKPAERNPEDFITEPQFKFLYEKTGITDSKELETWMRTTARANGLIEPVSVQDFTRVAGKKLCELALAEYKAKQEAAKSDVPE